jgi:hypothetical protein
MALSRQEVATTTKGSDGAQVTELNTYAPSVYGVARDEQGGGPKLREQLVTVRREANGGVSETTSVRRPTVSDPNRLGEPTVIFNLVCTDTCGRALPAPQTKKP